MISSFVSTTYDFCSPFALLNLSLVITLAKLLSVSVSDQYKDGSGMKMLRALCVDTWQLIYPIVEFNSYTQRAYVFCLFLV